MKGPIPYLGGKSRLADRILPLLPSPNRDHTYVEPFCGGASVLFARKPIGIEVLNDRNGDVVHLFRILRDRGDELREYLQNVPYARSIYDEWSNPRYVSRDDIERAARTFFLARATFMSATQRPEDRSVAGFAVARFRDNRARSMQNKVDEELPQIRDRLRHVVIECDDALGVIDRYDSENTILYCDPPYLPDTRKAIGHNGIGYAHEYGVEDHERLLLRLKESPGFVALSGYASELYADLLESDGWERRDFPWHCHTVRNTKGGENPELDAQRTESVWINPLLVDYRERSRGRQQSIFLEPVSSVA